MANKKINELSVRTPSLSDLMLVGDPSTGYSYKATISSLSTLLEANIALNDLSDVVITSVANGNLLAYNGTNWVNRTLGAYLGGTITQYVRGDGSLGDFAGGGGGGGASVSYYLNGSVNQGTFSGNTYYEMNKTPIAGAGTNFTINANGYIASFITDAGDPALLKIPGGNWNLEFYFSASSGGGSPSFYAELYKYDGTTFTLIASNSASPEGITNGTANDAYFTALAVPETVLSLTDRLAIRVYVTHSGRTITLHTENSNLCQIITTFTTGLTALNNLTAQVQFFATGTSGTDFAISSTTATHTFNLPTASGTNRGALSSADWTTFNGKVGGSGTTNYVSKFTASGTIGNSQIFDNGTNVGIGTASPTAKITMFGTNPTFRVQGDGVSYYGGIDFWSSVSGSNRLNGSVTQYDANGLYIGSGTGMRLTFTTNNGTEAMRLTSAGRLLIGTTTESTFLLDVNGTARINGVLQFGSTPTIESFAANQQIKITSALGLTISSDRWNSNTSTSSYIQNGFTTKYFVSTGPVNNNYACFDFSNSRAFDPTLSVNYSQKLINGAMTINSTGIANFFGVDSRTTDNSASIANNVYAIYGDATLGTNTSANRWAGYFVGRGYFSQVLAIGTTSPNASALLDITSTTKGFLPPRMTNAQMVAIATPAAGLVVYDTTNNKLNVYDGTNWVAVH